MVLRRTNKIIGSDTTPIYYRKTFETVLRETNAAVQKEMSARGRLATETSESDPLTRLCRRLYQQEPKLSEMDLRRKLKAEAGKGVVVLTDKSPANS
jgi:hypothetical protein